MLADRVLRVFSTQNTVGISADREQIAGAVRKEVGTALQTVFGLEITDLQLSSTCNPSFQTSVEAAIRAKNDAIRAENTVVKVRYEGEQPKVQADGEATQRWWRTAPCGTCPGSIPRWSRPTPSSGTIASRQP